MYNVIESESEKTVLVKKLEEDFRETERFREGKENQAVFMVKERAIEVFELLFNFRFYVRLQVRITKYHITEESKTRYYIQSRQCLTLGLLYVLWMRFEPMATIGCSTI